MRLRAKPSHAVPQWEITLITPRASRKLNSKRPPAPGFGCAQYLVDDGGPSKIICDISSSAAIDMSQPYTPDVKSSCIIKAA